jgi:hypothetical protein
MGGGSLLDLLLKHIFQRQRLLLENPLVTLSSYGFPGGHTLGAILFFGILALFIGLGNCEMMASTSSVFSQRVASRFVNWAKPKLSRSTLSEQRYGRDYRRYRVAGRLLDRDRNFATASTMKFSSAPPSRQRTQSQHS